VLFVFGSFIYRVEREMNEKLNFHEPRVHWERREVILTK